MKKGFTILELVVVLSVLVILIGIAIPRIKGMQQSGQIVQAKAELQTLQTAMESYYNNSPTPHTYIPTTTAPCTQYFSVSTPQVVSSTCPMDPFGTAANTEYFAVVNGNYYAIGSVGAGGTAALTSANFTVDSGTGAVTTTSGNPNQLCVTNGKNC